MPTKETRDIHRNHCKEKGKSNIPPVTMPTNFNTLNKKHK
ncbi:unnamed protein product [marine sediment metagenome]|uniref:Uncharacterized protein n=1 Tax=marine sediment metagenome TaxID=412755 RepID=X1IY63_9ZZZZ